MLPRLRYQRHDGGSSRARQRRSRGARVQSALRTAAASARRSTVGSASPAYRRASMPRASRSACGCVVGGQLGDEPVAGLPRRGDLGPVQPQVPGRVPDLGPQAFGPAGPAVGRTAGAGSGCGSATGCTAAGSTPTPMAIAAPPPLVNQLPPSMIADAAVVRQVAVAVRLARSPGPRSLPGVIGAVLGAVVGLVGSGAAATVQFGVRRHPRGRGRLEADPADALEVQLRPGVHVVHPDRELAVLAGRPGQEADADPGRDADDARHQRHPGGELLAVPGLVRAAGSRCIAAIPLPRGVLRCCR